MSPVDQLNKVMKRHPSTSEYVNRFLLGRGKDYPDWPGWCFLPMGAWYAIAKLTNQLEDVAALAALGTWRYTQGIFRFHDDLLSALLDSEVTGNIPTDVLKRLPEWCIYIETPNIILAGKEISGFFAHLEKDLNNGNEELRLLLNLSDGSLVPVPVQIGEWTIKESIKKMVDIASENANIDEVTEIITTNTYITTLSEMASRLLSIILYICSEEPEIDNERVPGKSFYHPELTKTKKGWRLFPAAKPHVWNVGQVIGKQISHEKASKRTGGTVRTHIRRGHWHGYWTGPRDGKRKFIYRWLPPMVVGGNN